MAIAIIRITRITVTVVFMLSSGGSSSGVVGPQLVQFIITACVYFFFKL